VFALTDSIGSAPSADSKVMAADGSITTRSYDFRNSSHVYRQIGATTQQTALNTGIDALMDNYNIQVELGSQATSYAPYFTPIELCKIGDYQDYIYENEGKWYVHKETNKKVFTGAEQWFRSGRTTASVFVASLDVLSLTIKNDTKNQSLMDYFRYVPAVSMKIGTFDLYNGSASVEYIALALDATSVPDATAVKAWVEANHPAICYILTTPTDTEITNTALIDQLNALKKGGSYTGTTYIKVSATDPNLPGLLEVEAYKYD
jgi:hypothetical protein